MIWKTNQFSSLISTKTELKETRFYPPGQTNFYIIRQSMSWRTEPSSEEAYIKPYIGSGRPSVVGKGEQNLTSGGQMKRIEFFSIIELNNIQLLCQRSNKQIPFQTRTHQSLNDQISQTKNSKQRKISANQPQKKLSKLKLARKRTN